MKYQFPKGLYGDVRMEEEYTVWMDRQNGEVISDGDFADVGAMIRIYDGQQWYTCSTNDTDRIQEEINNLAALATVNPKIDEDETVKRMEVNRDTILKYEGERNLREISRQDWIAILDYYQEKCMQEELAEIKAKHLGISGGYKKISFFSSKGAEIAWDDQRICLNVFYTLGHQDIVSYAGKYYLKHTMEELYGHEKEIMKERDKTISFMKEAVNVEPGDYTCVFSPITTALFTHESFGHKSESDYMLNDKALQEEWVLGKKVGNERVSIFDRGDLDNAGYTPYDAEGTKARTNYLIQNGELVGRLHNAKSAATLSEDVTGNARAQSYHAKPIVRMTNTYMEAGTEDPADMIANVKDGIYVDMIESGTGFANFSMVPSRCYRIRDGKIAEAVRVNIIMGNVFETLFDVEAVGSDFTAFEIFTCGKNGQWINVGCAGPSITIKKLKLS